MHAHAALTVGPPARPGGCCRVTHMVDAAPIGWRPTPGAVYVVGTSAAPVGDDRVTMRVEVEAGAALTIRSAAATVIWSGQGTCHTTDVRVASGAHLDWQPEPIVATSGCRHRHVVTVALEGTAELRWREVLILGRHGETTGSVHSSLSVDLDGAPLLRHSLSVGPAAGRGWDGPAVLGSTRAVGLQLVAGVTQPASRPGAGPGWAVLPLDGPAVLMLATASTSSAVEAALAAAAAAAAAASGASDRRLLDTTTTSGHQPTADVGARPEV